MNVVSTIRARLIAGVARDGMAHLPLDLSPSPSQYRLQALTKSVAALRRGACQRATQT
jgi:hypothetical protein